MKTYKIIGIEINYYPKGDRPVWMKINGKITPKEIKL